MGNSDIRVKLVNLCIQNDWFTSGTCSQYEKMLNFAESGGSVHEVALLIWMCTPDVLIDEIECRVSEL